MYTILGVVKRARWPADLEEAKAGGFVGGYTPNGAPIYRNPCSAQVLALLPNLRALLRYGGGGAVEKHCGFLIKMVMRMIIVFVIMVLFVIVVIVFVVMMIMFVIMMVFDCGDSF